MKRKSSCFSCVAILGLLIALAFVGFIAATSLMARAADSFGPPATTLGTIQRVRLGIELGWRAEALLRPVDAAAGTQNFDIGLNEPTVQIVGRMQEAGLIREANLFSDYLVYAGIDTQLQVSDYSLSPAMNAVEIAAALLDPTPGSVTLIILPGWRLEEIAAALPSAGVNVKPEDFLKYARSTPNELALSAQFPIGSSLEGFLLPGSYEIDRQADAITMLDGMLKTDIFSSEMSGELTAGFAEQGLSIYDALTLASIVERETVVESEMPLIASVFLNRLKANMKLEADPTVQYALGYDVASQSWWKTPLTASDLGINSPYNTYLNFGLPPGPIAAPSLKALQAVAFPASSSYFYFQAACDGSGRHVFAQTYEEHLANNCH